jgi:hypothetical protein
VEILENGPPGDRPRGTLGGRVLIGALVVAVVAVVAAAKTPISVARNEKQALTIAGRVACGAPAPGAPPLAVLVDGEQATVAMPRINDENWAAAMTHSLC